MKIEWRNTRFRFRIKSWQFLAIWSLPFYKLFKCSRSLKITEVETVIEFQRWKDLIRWPPNGKRSHLPVLRETWLESECSNKEDHGWCAISLGGEQNSSRRPSEQPWWIWFTTLCAPLFFCKINWTLRTREVN